MDFPWVWRMRKSLATFSDCLFGLWCSSPTLLLNTLIIVIQEVDEYTDDNVKRFCSDHTLHRYLRARQWDVNKARSSHLLKVKFLFIPNTRRYIDYSVLSEYHS